MKRASFSQRPRSTTSSRALSGGSTLRRTVRHVTPYVQRVLEWFGAERCVFRSDWPVCLVAASYARVIDLCGQAIGDLPADDRERIFGGNAALAYRLPVPANADRRS